MRPWLPLVFAVVIATAADPPTLMVDDLEGHGQAVRRVLEAIGRGDHAPLADCPDGWFGMPIGIERDDGTLIHWTQDLRQRLAVLPDAERTPALAVLEARFRRLSGRGGAAASSLAPGFLPASSALTAVRSLADKAFDRGDFHGFLGLIHLLPTTLRAQAYQERLGVARRFLGALGPEEDPWPAFRPGPLEAFTPRFIRDPGQGAAVTWHRRGRLLQALGTTGQPLWQRLTPEDAQIATGPGAAAIAAGGRLIVLDEHGVKRDLPIETGFRLLGVRASVAWLAREGEVLGVPVHHSFRFQAHLGDTPLAPPLPLGRSSLWLTGRCVVLVRDGAVAGRWEHGLEEPSRWAWCWADERPTLAHPDLGFLAIGDLATHLAAAADPLVATRLRIAAAGIDDAWTTAQKLPPGALRDRCLALVVAVDPGRIETLADRGQVLTTDTREGLLALNALYRAGRLAEAALRQRLQALAVRHADTWLPATVVDSLDPVNWPHALTAGVLARILAQEPARILAASCQADRHPRLGSIYRVGSWCLTVEARDGATALAAFTAEGQPLWRHRWPVRGYLPSRSLECADGFLVVVEGQSRLAVVDPADGTRLVHLNLREAVTGSGRLALCGPRHLAILHPIGIGSHLTLLNVPPGAEERPLVKTLDLTPAAVAIRGTPSGFSLTLTDGTVRAVAVLMPPD